MGFYNKAGNNESSSFLPHIKYDARFGEIIRPDKETGDQNITSTFKAVFDFENLECGFARFISGQAPEYRMTPYYAPGGWQAPEKPEGKFKSGFRIYIKLSKECGGDIRELAGSAALLCKAFDALQDEYDAGRVNNPGKLPVVVLKETISITSEVTNEAGERVKVKNKQPVFGIVSWVSRPDGFPVVAKAAPAPAPARAAPPSTGSSRATPPPVVEVDEDDFG